MYIKIDQNITPDQLVAIAKILDTDGLECINNIHYETCMYEIQCCMENMFETEELKKMQAQPEYYEKINDLASILYNRSDYQWDCLYDKAEEVVNDYMEDLAIDLLDSLE